MSVKGAQHEDSAALGASDAGALCHSWRHCNGVGAAIYEQRQSVFWEVFFCCLRPGGRRHGFVVVGRILSVVVLLSALVEVEVEVPRFFRALFKRCWTLAATKIQRKFLSQNLKKFLNIITAFPYL